MLLNAVTTGINHFIRVGKLSIIRELAAEHIDDLDLRLDRASESPVQRFSQYPLLPSNNRLSCHQTIGCHEQSSHVTPIRRFFEILERFLRIFFDDTINAGKINNTKFIQCLRRSLFNCLL